MEYTVFLDRDGVINKDSCEYIKDKSEFEFIPKSPEAVARLNKSGFQVIVITNQSVINRKMVKKQTLDEIFSKMKKGIQKAGGDILDIFYCPHTPEDNCLCRKPEPGLILDALKKYSIDPDNCFMVGDNAKDIECALSAGCANALLVETGNGIKAGTKLFQKGITPVHTAADLYDAADWIIKKVKK